MVRRQGVARFRLARSRALFALIAIVLLFFPTLAAAHAVLTSSIPAQGERLRVSPKVLSLRFSEAVTRVDATLVGRDGGQLKLQTVVAGGDVSAELPNALADGAYAFTWRVVSEDGHPVSASVVFSIGEGSDSSDFTAATSDVGWIGTATWGAKFVFYCATLFGIGGVFFSVVIARTTPGRATTAMLAVSGLCALILVALFCLEETGGNLVALAGSDIWIVAFHCSLSKSMAFVLIALGLAFAAGRATTLATGLAILALAALGPAFALTGHASGAGVRWLSFSAVSVHVIAVCFWAGALPALRSILGPEKPGQREALLRFSSAIPLSVAAMLVAGGYLAFLQVGALSALWNTDYGKILLVKLALVSTALVLGAWNRIFLTAQVAQGRRSAANAMKAVVGAEIVLMILVLGVSAMWRFTPPPRALAQAAPVTTSIHLHDAAAMATVSFETGADLRFDVEVSLLTGELDPMDPPEVELKMTSADGSIAPFNVAVHRVSPGLWAATQVQAPCDCEWKVGLGVLVSDFEKVDLNGSVRLRSAED